MAVHKYTNAKVDVIGYSMGSPISRKAILGGKCVETGEDLGNPLTSVVDTFVGVAGANHGATFCFLQFGETCGMFLSTSIVLPLSFHIHNYLMFFYTKTDISPPAKLT